MNLATIPHLIQFGGTVTIAVVHRRADGSLMMRRPMILRNVSPVCPRCGYPHNRCECQPHNNPRREEG
jgi:hypothetical protein